VFSQDDPRLSSKDFSRIQKLMRDIAGIDLGPSKNALVQARLSKEIRLRGLTSFGEYVDLLERDESGEELARMVELLTTNYTFFFRERDHFDYLRTRFFPALAGRRVRCWSAGCSTGEEPYTLAMVGLESLGDGPDVDLRILATDISGRVLDHARRGIYSGKRLSAVPRDLLPKYFEPHMDSMELTYKVGPALRRVVHFAYLNLLSRWPMSGPFDLIMCRNVMIYFARDVRTELMKRFINLLRPGGLIILGHSEFLECRDLPFESVAPSVYRKV